MLEYDGSPKSAIWLIGDSNPKNCDEGLKPLDRRHPTRHNIWTPIWHVIQGDVFDATKGRLRDVLYVRNAVGNAAHKGNREERGKAAVVLGRLLEEHRPPIVLCFGQFAFGLVQQARGRVEAARSWRVYKLAEQFSNRISAFEPDSVNVLPLLHAIVARKYERCHEDFSGGQGNYFEYVGHKLSKVLIDNRSNARLSSLWI
jgi:hypothetical protein